MKPYQRETFKLSAGPCAAQGYLMTIHIGNFIRSDGKTFPVPSGHRLRGTWGLSSTVWAVGNEQQAVPDSLEILYFSYLEDELYEGTFALPQERIYQLLKAGYWNTSTGQAETYHKFTVCVLPKGGVYVWLTGVGRQEFVGRFQAARSAADFNRTSSGGDRAVLARAARAEAPAAVQEQVRAGTLSTRQWDEYLKQYPWRVAFNQPLTPYKPHNIDYVNAEGSAYPLTADYAPYFRALLEPSPKPVPRSLNLYLQAEHGARYFLRVDPFDEAETLAAFRALHAASPASPITLLYTFDKPLTKATLSLKNETKEIPLLKSTVEIIPKKQ